MGCDVSEVCAMVEGRGGLSALARATLGARDCTVAVNYHKKIFCP